MGGALILAVLVPAVPAASQTSVPTLARLTLVEPPVERQEGGASWREAAEGQPVKIGENLRTGPVGLARLELQWMVLTVSPSSTVAFPDDFLLSANLETGRVVVASESRDALKLVTAEAAIRGKGRAVVRREGARTLVSCLEGRFLVEGAGGGVWLDGGEGTVVASGGRPLAPLPTPEPPATRSLLPGQDPVYVTPGDPLELRWESDQPAFQVEILPVGSDYVLIQRDVGPPPARVAIPWGGAFRWRIAARDDRGLEGRPSGDGQIAVELAQ
jgi:hypothetical protein